MPNKELPYDLAPHKTDQIAALLSEIEKLETKSRFDYLGERYPSVHIYVMTKLKMKQSLEKYINSCFKLENDYKEYSLYVHGYLLPWF